MYKTGSGGSWVGTQLRGSSVPVFTFLLECYYTPSETHAWSLEGNVNLCIKFERLFGCS